MKVIFLDVDGVLNSFNTMNTDNSLEMGPIQNLAGIILTTDAKIILTSSWRLSTEALRTLMDKLMRCGLSISGYTQEGANMRNFENTPFENVVPTKKYTRSGTYTYDRGAEIAMWVLEHSYNLEEFVILDDEDEDIKNWFPNQLVKTDFMKGLTWEDAAKAIKLLN